MPGGRSAREPDHIEIDALRVPLRRPLNRCAIGAGCNKELLCEAPEQLAQIRTQVDAQVVPDPGIGSGEHDEATASGAEPGRQ